MNMMQEMTQALESMQNTDNEVNVISGIALELVKIRQPVPNDKSAMNYIASDAVYMFAAILDAIQQRSNISSTQPANKNENPNTASKLPKLPFRETKIGMASLEEIESNP